MKSVLIRPPASAYSIRPRCVKPRLPPSPTTRARTCDPLTRTLLFVRSPASACTSREDFTYVPIPPFHSRSTGACRIQRISSSGVISSATSSGIASDTRASFEGTTALARRSKTSPPGDSSVRS